MATTVHTTANALGHRAAWAARMGLRLPTIRLADGRELKVRGARFSPTTTTLLYEAGPSDSYRHTYVVERVADELLDLVATRDITGVPPVWREVLEGSEPLSTVQLSELLAWLHDCPAI